MTARINAPKAFLVFHSNNTVLNCHMTDKKINMALKIDYLKKYLPSVQSSEGKGK